LLANVGFSEIRITLKNISQPTFAVAPPSWGATAIIISMKIHFHLRYHTQSGESCLVSINGQAPQLLEYLNEERWHGFAEIDPKKVKILTWQYLFCAKDGTLTTEWETERCLDLDEFRVDNLEVTDYWNPASALENTFLTKPFKEIFFTPPQSPHAGGSASRSTDQQGQTEAFFPQKPSKVPDSPPHKGPGGRDVLFRIKAPLLHPDEAVCLLGHGNGLRNWDTAAPLVLERNGSWWEISLDLIRERFPLGYKYGVWNTRLNRFIGFEEGTNRVLTSPPSGAASLLHDGFARFPFIPWRGAGVAIPVFSLRSKKSWGVGEFTDLLLLADWSKSVGLKIIQLLPINDTTSTHTWTDSYPYAPVSVFALHPIYLNVEQVAGKKNAAILKPFLKKQKSLNALETVDYEAVLQTKWDIIRQLYDLQKADWLQDTAYQTYYEANKHWLEPYATFCWLRDANSTADFNRWSSHSTYKAADIEKLLSPKSKQFDQIALHLFVQWHLHLQLEAAVQYCHANGLALKGDLPIGIYRYSCDAWMAPDLYDMDAQAGAPPDDFAEKGQNWGFPTYNWARMKADGFAWWKQRFSQMGLYFDAFRIDHILGFFRIWSIPLDAVEGILGQFVPAIPVTEQEFQAAGIGFSHDRLCKPYITERVLWGTFGANAHIVAENFLLPRDDDRFDLRPEFDTQRKVQAYFNSKEPNDYQRQLRDGLYSLIANVILLDGTASTTEGNWSGAFRFGIEKISSFQALPAQVKDSLKSLYVNYFYRRQDEFWRLQAMDKLPALKRSTDMLICGEDLGMVPDCVPGVMHELGLLSLEIQRMPKAPGSSFFHPKDAPYLSVLTPGTHDMSALRGWWEEDRALTQRFYNEILQQSGDAPWFCEPYLVQMMLEQHLHSPAMWSIFQLQDLLGMDGSLRRENPHDERINVPANPKHYWCYRVHLLLEDLIAAEKLNGELRRMVVESGR